MSNVYIYVIARDFGFAPNPFHGYCTLATCKPDIRNTAVTNDWVIGVGGRKLKATGRCIVAMKVTGKITFNEYWINPRYNDKKPVRNGSRRMLVGDNIYFEESGWHQAPSHHSLPDGSPNLYNIQRDTKSKYVLLSDHFFYFGSSAPIIPSHLLDDIGYKNKVGHRVFSYENSASIVDWLYNEYGECINLVIADPFNFQYSHAHYSVGNNRIIH